MKLYVYETKKKRNYALRVMVSFIFHFNSTFLGCFLLGFWFQKAKSQLKGWKLEAASEEAATLGQYSFKSTLDPAFAFLLFKMMKIESCFKKNRDGRVRIALYCKPSVCAFLRYPLSPSQSLSHIGMKTDRIWTNITNIIFVFIFLFGLGFEYG